MSTNCLVKKLKEVVDNEMLPTFGYQSFKYTATETGIIQTPFYYTNAPQSTICVLHGDGYFTADAAGSQSLGKTAPLRNIKRIKINSEGTFLFEITNASLETLDHIYLTANWSYSIYNVLRTAQTILKPTECSFENADIEEDTKHISYNMADVVSIVKPVSIYVHKNGWGSGVLKNVFGSVRISTMCLRGTWMNLTGSVDEMLTTMAQNITADRNIRLEFGYLPNCTYTGTGESPQVVNSLNKNFSLHVGGTWEEV